MHELRVKLKSLTAEMWKVKDNKENISVEELVNFCDEFYAYRNFGQDMLDGLIMKGGLSEQEKEAVVSLLRRLNGNTYRCLVIDDLMELDCASGENYLREIISTPQLYSAFQDDFAHHPQYEKYLALFTAQAKCVPPI